MPLQYNTKISLNNGKQLIKEMSQSTLEEELNNSINQLNAEQTEYWEFIQTCKGKLANAITEIGVSTSEYDRADTMAANIKSIKDLNRNTLEFTVDNVIKPFIFTNQNFTKVYVTPSVTVTNSSGNTMNVSLWATESVQEQTTYTLLFSVPFSSANKDTTLEFDISNYSDMGALVIGNGKGSSPTSTTATYTSIWKFE